MNFLVVDTENDIIMSQPSTAAQAQTDLTTCQAMDPKGKYEIFIRQEFVVEHIAQLALDLYNQ